MPSDVQGPPPRAPPSAGATFDDEPPQPTSRSAQANPSIARGEGSRNMGMLLADLVCPRSQNRSRAPSRFEQDFVAGALRSSGRRRSYVVSPLFRHVSPILALAWALSECAAPEIYYEDPGGVDPSDSGERDDRGNDGPNGSDIVEHDGRPAADPDDVTAKGFLGQCRSRRCCD